MVKVSISLPNNTQITFESEESEVLREIVGMALRDLPRDLMRSASADTQSADTQSAGNGNPAGAPAAHSTSQA